MGEWDGENEGGRGLAYSHEGNDAPGPRGMQLCVVSV